MSGMRFSFLGRRTYRDNHYATRYGIFELWLHRCLYRLSLVVAAALAVAVLVLPWIPVAAAEDLVSQAGMLFARDETLRKTAVVSAVGLWLTAIVFFRPREARQWVWRRGRFVSLD